MKYKIGDLVTSPYFVVEAVGVITQTHFSSWSNRSDYWITIEHEGNTYSRNLYEEDLELVEAPAQDYLDLFI